MLSGATGQPFSILTINFIQVQGGVEHFSDECGGIPDWLNSLTYYTAFTEGWALYAEKPLIADDTDTYEGAENLMQKYGMLKWQVRQ